MVKRKAAADGESARWKLLANHIEARLQKVDAPIMRRLKEMVLLIKGGMPLAGFLSGIMYMISATARWRTLLFYEQGDRANRVRLPFGQFFVIARCATHDEPAPKSKPLFPASRRNPSHPVIPAGPPPARPLPARRLTCPTVASPSPSYRVRSRSSRRPCMMKSLISDLFGNEAIVAHAKKWKEASSAYITALHNTCEQCVNGAYKWLGSDASTSGLTTFCGDHPLCDRYALNNDELKAFEKRILANDGASGAQNEQLFLRSWDSKPLSLLNTNGDVETGAFALPMLLFGQPVPHRNLIGGMDGKGIGWPPRPIHTSYERTLRTAVEERNVDVRIAYSSFKAEEYLVTGALQAFTYYIHSVARMVDEYTPAAAEVGALKDFRKLQLTSDKRQEDELLRRLDAAIADLDDGSCQTRTAAWGAADGRGNGGFEVPQLVAVAEKLYCDLEDARLKSLLAALKDDTPNDARPESAPEEGSEMSSLIPPSAERKMPKVIDFGVEAPEQYRVPEIPKMEKSSSKKKKSVEDEEPSIDAAALERLRKEKAARMSGALFPSPKPFGEETNKDIRSGDEALHEAIERFRIKSIAPEDATLDELFACDCYGKSEVNVLMLVNLASYANDAATILEDARVQYGNSKFKKVGDRQLMVLLKTYLEQPYESTRWTHNVPDKTVANFTAVDVDVAVAMCENSVATLYLSYCEYHSIEPNLFCFTPEVVPVSTDDTSETAETGGGGPSGAGAGKKQRILDALKKNALKVLAVECIIVLKRDAGINETDFRETCQYLQKMGLGLYVSVPPVKFSAKATPFDKASLQAVPGGATSKFFLKTPVNVHDKAKTLSLIASAQLSNPVGLQLLNWRDGMLREPTQPVGLRRAANYFRMLISCVSFAGHGPELLHAADRADEPPNKQMLRLAQSLYAFTDDTQLLSEASDARRALRKFFQNPSGEGGSSGDTGGDATPSKMHTLHSVLWNAVVNSAAVNFSQHLAHEAGDDDLDAPFMPYANDAWRPASIATSSSQGSISQSSLASAASSF